MAKGKIQVNTRGEVQHNGQEGGSMTRIEDYYRDMEKVWSAIVVLGSILLTFILVLVLHLLSGRG